MSAAVRVELPSSLRQLAQTPALVTLTIEGAVTQCSLLDALEARFPALEGTLRDHNTKIRRPFIRFFAEGRDLSHHAPDAPLPASIADGSEPFLIIGAIAGG
jgi:molybdopterin converting factor small subunit